MLEPAPPTSPPPSCVWVDRGFFFTALVLLSSTFFVGRHKGPGRNRKPLPLFFFFGKSESFQFFFLFLFLLSRFHKDISAGWRGCVHLFFSPTGSDASEKRLMCFPPFCHSSYTDDGSSDGCCPSFPLSSRSRRPFQPIPLRDRPGHAARSAYVKSSGDSFLFFSGRQLASAVRVERTQTFFLLSLEIETQQGCYQTKPGNPLSPLLPLFFFPLLE